MEPDSSPRWHSPPPRLRPFSYTGQYGYSLTLCSANRKPLLHGPDKIARLSSLLEDCAARQHFQVWAYCFMPDHLHLLVSGDGSSSLREFVRLFKQVSGYWHKSDFAEKLWQSSYYDHILRKDEDLLRVARYIFENPFRKGIVKNWQDYPFMGPLEVVASLAGGEDHRIAEQTLITNAGEVGSRRPNATLECAES